VLKVVVLDRLGGQLERTFLFIDRADRYLLIIINISSICSICSIRLLRPEASARYLVLVEVAEGELSCHLNGFGVARLIFPILQTLREVHDQGE